MQTATILLALGGDSGNVVPKHHVTPAEVAVLRYIHGDDAVTDINPTGTVVRKNRDERQRLGQVYGRRVDGDRHVAPAVDALFPGAAARVFETFDELDLPEEMFKAASRVSAKGTTARAVAQPEPPVEEPVEEPVEPAEDATEDPAEDPAEESEDGISDINDSVAQKGSDGLFN